MRRFAKVWSVTGVSWAAVVALTGAAIAGVLAESPPTLKLSPKGAVEGKTLDSDEAFEMTVHLQGDARSTYDLAVTYADDAVGTCQEDAATITTNPQGKGVWTCEFDTAANDGTEAMTGTVTFTASQEGSDPVAIVATLSVRPAEEAEVEEEEEVVAEEEEETTDAESTINHGHCVSYWAHESKAQGLEGRNRGAFISSIAQDPEAVAPKTARGEDPGDDCDYQDELTEALEAQAAAAEAEGDDATAKSSKGHGKKQNADADTDTDTK